MQAQNSVTITYLCKILLFWVGIEVGPAPCRLSSSKPRMPYAMVATTLPAPLDMICPLYKYLFCLCSCKDRAFSATSATLEGKKAMVATTWAMPMSPIISKGDTNRVKDLDRVSPTVIRPRQSSVSSVGEPFGVVLGVQESDTWLGYD